MGSSRGLSLRSSRASPFEALDDAFCSLSFGDRLALYRKLRVSDAAVDEEGQQPRAGVEMCVFMEKDFQAFDVARKSVAPDEDEDEEDEE